MNREEREQAKAFSKLDYEGFRNLATRTDLSRYQRIGFPDSFRAGRETDILADIRAKLPLFDAAEGLEILDIGPGCSDLPNLIIDHCRGKNNRITLVDSPEMLSGLPDGADIRKIAGPFPQCAASLQAYHEKIDIIICYSVIHYVFLEGQIFAFLDAALKLLRPGGGMMIIGDVPNASMRRRFLASAAGIAFHRDYTGTDTLPDPGFNHFAEGEMDDAVIISLIARARAAGVDSWIVPQPSHLPMANRREDLIFRRP